MKPADASSRHEELTNGELRAAIARLSPSDRAVLVLFYLEELSGEQVAEALGVRVDAVHVHEGAWLDGRVLVVRPQRLQRLGVEPVEGCLDHVAVATRLDLVNHVNDRIVQLQ